MKILEALIIIVALFALGIVGGLERGMLGIGAATILLVLAAAAITILVSIRRTVQRLDSIHRHRFRSVRGKRGTVTVFRAEAGASFSRTPTSAGLVRFIGPGVPSERRTWSISHRFIICTERK